MGFLLELGRRVVLLFLEIPLVDDDNQPASVLPCQSGDLQILIVKSFGGVEPKDEDVRAVDRAARSQRRIELDALVHLRLTPKPGGIDEDEIPAVKNHRGIDRVTR